MSKPKVVIVDDEFLIADYLAQLCEDMGAFVAGMAAQPNEALALILSARPDFVLMDVRLKGKRDGVDIAKAVYDEAPQTKIIFITGSNEPPTIERVKTDHPYRILVKPIDPNDLREALLGASG